MCGHVKRDEGIEYDDQEEENDLPDAIPATAIDQKQESGADGYQPPEVADIVGQMSRGTQEESGR